MGLLTQSLSRVSSFSLRLPPVCLAYSFFSVLFGSEKHPHLRMRSQFLANSGISPFLCNQDLFSVPPVLSLNWGFLASSFSVITAVVNVFYVFRLLDRLALTWNVKWDPSDRR